MFSKNPGASETFLSWSWILAASRDANQQAERVANAPPVATPPSDLEQSKHRLTHLPYAAWCSSCVAHRARPNRHENKGESHAGEIPTVSFDFFYTKADGEAPDGADDVADSILSLIIVCSHTGFTACVPLQSKNQMDVMNRELIQFGPDVGAFRDHFPLRQRTIHFAVAAPGCEDQTEHGFQDEDVELSGL